MKTDVFAAILTKLNGDATLTSYLGSNRFFRSKRTSPAVFPCATVFENNEHSTLRPGYCTAKVRDNVPTIQVDIWVSAADESFPCEGEDADLIADRIDAVLLDATSEVTGTRAGTWRKVTSSQQYEEDTQIWHNALRYSFQYKITDT